MIKNICLITLVTCSFSSQMFCQPLIIPGNPGTLQYRLVTSVDYLIAKNNMDRATINATITRYEFVFRNKILDFYEGKPLW